MRPISEKSHINSRYSSKSLYVPQDSPDENEGTDSLSIHLNLGKANTDPWNK